MRQHHRGQPRSQAEADLDLHSPKVQLTIGEDESVEYLATYSEKSVSGLDATLAFKAVECTRDTGHLIHSWVLREVEEQFGICSGIQIEYG